MQFVHFEPVAFVEPAAGLAAVAAPAVAAAATELFLLQHAVGLEGRQLVPVAVLLPLAPVVALTPPVADAELHLAAVAADGVPPAGELVQPGVA